MAHNFTSRKKIPIDKAIPRLIAARDNAGLNQSEWARASGVMPKTIRYILTRQSDHVQLKTYRALVDMPNMRLEARRIYPVGGTVVRLKAAAAIGWGQRVMRKTYPSLATLSQFEGQQYVTIVTVNSVMEFLRMAMADPKREGIGPTKAKARGWLPPEAYDQDTLFDPMWDGKGGLLDRRPAEGRELWEEYTYFTEVMMLDHVDALNLIGRDEPWFIKARDRYAKHD